MRRLSSDLGGRAVLAAAVAAFLLLCWLLRDFVTDDAWISLRYAQNLAEGHGFVWNPGGVPVEGFSNPLLVALEALGYAVGIGGLVVARAAGVLSGVAVLILLFVYARRVLGAIEAGVATVLVALSAALAFWAVGGLETLPVALALTAGTLELARPGGGSALRAGLWLSVLPWLRPEGIVVALALAGLSEVVGLLRADQRRAALRRLALVAGLPVLSQLLLELGRLTAYGHLVPNSVIYKSGTGELGEVTIKFLMQAAPVAPLAVAGALILPGRLRLLAVPPAVYIAGSVVMLDSVNAFSRFLLPVWPLVVLLAGAAVAAAVRSLTPGRRWAPVGAAAAVTAVLAGYLLVVNPAGILPARASAESYERCRSAPRADAARWLRENTPPDAVVSVSDAGLLPAQAGGRFIIDQFMLNSPLLQEVGVVGTAQRAEIVHAAEPHAIVLASHDPEEFTPEYGTDGAVAAHVGFADYELAYVASGDGDCGYHLFVYTGG
jgi:arabinofuranosyltransferase